MVHSKDITWISSASPGRAAEARRWGRRPPRSRRTAVAGSLPESGCPACVPTPRRCQTSAGSEPGSGCRAQRSGLAWPEVLARTVGRGVLEPAAARRSVPG